MEAHTIDFLEQVFDQKQVLALIKWEEKKTHERNLVTSKELDFKIEELRQDIQILREETKKDIQILRNDTQKDIQVLRNDIQILRNDTQKDIQVLRNEIQKDLQILRGEIETAIVKSQNKIIIWVISAMGIFATLIKILDIIFK